MGTMTVVQGVPSLTGLDADIHDLHSTLTPDIERDRLSLFTNADRLRQCSTGCNHLAVDGSDDVAHPDASTRGRAFIDHLGHHRTRILGYTEMLT